jgi:FMN phosphatase YigB (HAD superfamily)
LNRIVTLKYRAALFDLDDTLFDHQAHRREALAALGWNIPALSGISLEALESAHTFTCNEHISPSSMARSRSHNHEPNECAGY